MEKDQIKRITSIIFAVIWSIVYVVYLIFYWDSIWSSIWDTIWKLWFPGMTVLLIIFISIAVAMWFQNKKLKKTNRME